MSAATIANIQRLRRPLSGSAPATELFPVRDQVSSANNAHLERLTTASLTYTSRDSGSAPADQRTKLLNAMLAPATLTLKVGAQVMLVKNLDTPRGLCNGAVGVVQSFRYGPKGSEFKKSASFCDYAVDEDELIDLCTGEAASDDVVHEGRTSRLFPVVRFYVRDGEITVLVMDDEITIKDQHSTTLAKRIQVGHG